MSYKIRKLYEAEDFSGIINIMNERMYNNSLITEEDIILYGCVLTKIGKMEYASLCFESLDISRRKGWYAKYFIYYALCKYALGDYKKSKEILELLLKWRNTRSNASSWLRLLDFNNFMQFVESDNIRYHFEPGLTEKQKVDYIKICETTYRYLISIFKVLLPKKIDVFAFSRQCDNIGNHLSYANPVLCTIHANIYHAHGHEMAHIIYSYLYDNIYKTRFIDEGIAVYFDLPYDGGIENEMVNANLPWVDVLSVWEKFESYARDDAYKIAGLFVGYLIQEYSLKKFLKFIEIQTLEYATEVYGNKIFSAIKKFEDILNKKVLSEVFADCIPEGEEYEEK